MRAHPVQTRPTPDREQIWRDRHHSGWIDYRARTSNLRPRTWRQRGGYSGYYLPVYEFNRHFGRHRRFRLFDLPFLIFSGRPHFQYDGYWIDFIDPYPYEWGDYWYESDDLYIDYYDDGYYLFNPRYPRHRGIAISIRISL